MLQPLYTFVTNKKGLGISLIPNFPYDDLAFKEHGQ